MFNFGIDMLWHAWNYILSYAISLTRNSEAVLGSLIRDALILVTFHSEFLQKLNIRTTPRYPCHRRLDVVVEWLWTDIPQLGCPPAEKPPCLLRCQHQPCFATGHQNQFSRRKSYCIQCRYCTVLYSIQRTNDQNRIEIINSIDNGNSGAALCRKSTALSVRSVYINADGQDTILPC